jgi:ribosomal protein S18 acetylase RimI-like enzyme
MAEWIISQMERKDLPEAARVLCEAMRFNPLHVAVFQSRDENARRRIEQMFLELFSELPGVTFLARRHGKIVGVMRMKSCEGRRPSAEVRAKKDLTNISARKSHWQNVWARHDPSDPHWHLGPIGVVPEYQRRGIGTVLLQRFCREVDACGAPAYLETDLPANVLFYEKHGFQVLGREDIFGVSNFFMWRPARD